ncbi:MAG: orotate phosphoribosyltransferase [Bacteroidetes bacterium]|jgi:orotate phosphoribosyltransferase|nr:orotate phosphoribosyltransferase [Bacteroidota bacterium]MBX7237834.1 orotate phosphoribosyltransferase [Bacteroidia bacterium]MCW5918225.1 orotate phosphoribosyltransferase [Bacteroidota bacterium]HCI58987.1 orotate phosphoribosyltransferase [Bacteroidota bacterium]HMU78373.1 orotate phosphoribosyltransferase [Bacteroidia bacterium]
MKDDTASNIADFLLQIKAIKLQPDEPFTWASGWKSPIYCDNRVALSNPRIRTYIRQELVKAIERNYGRPDAIAAVATGAIAQGALVSESMGLPFIYVRPEPKQHGAKNQIEGDISQIHSVVVVEDLISTGKSSLNAVAALRNSGIIVKGMVSIFNYGFDVARESFKNAQCPLYSLSNYDVMITKALQSKYINEGQMESLKDWREHPDSWNK